MNFDVQNGEILGFVGLNGSGKTTTIRIAAGVSLPTKGTVLMDGHDVVKEKVAASRSVGWVPEFPNFELNARARDLLLYFAGFYGISKGEAAKRASELFTALGLSGSENRKLRTYSQGMKKRFSLVASILPDPQNYLLDEILNGLDPEGVKFVRKLLVEQRKRNKAILLSSHILAEVQALSDRVAFIHRGKLVKVVTRGELERASGIGSSGGTNEGDGIVLRIVISNLNDNALTYLRTLGGVQVAQAGEVLLSNFHGDSSELVAELVKRGLMVREITREKSSLEEYFFRLIGEKETEVHAGRNEVVE